MIQLNTIPIQQTNSNMSLKNRTDNIKRAALYTATGTLGGIAGYWNYICPSQSPIKRKNILYKNTSNGKPIMNKNRRVFSKKLSGGYVVEDVKLTESEKELANKDFEKAKIFLRKIKLKKYKNIFIGVLLGLLSGFVIDKIFIKK